MLDIASITQVQTILKHTSDGQTHPVWLWFSLLGPWACLSLPPGEDPLLTSASFPHFTSLSLSVFTRDSNLFLFTSFSLYLSLFILIISHPCRRSSCFLSPLSLSSPRPPETNNHTSQFDNVNIKFGPPLKKTKQMLTCVAPRLRRSTTYKKKKNKKTIGLRQKQPGTQDYCFLLSFSANFSFISYHNDTIYALFYKDKELYRAV